MPYGRCRLRHGTWPPPQNLGKVTGVRLFMILDDLSEGGSGTLVLTGSHRLVNRYSPLLLENRGPDRSNRLSDLRANGWLDYGGPRHRMMMPARGIGALWVRERRLAMFRSPYGNCTARGATSS